MNLEEYPTIFVNFYFVRQNNCEFRWDANIKNILTYFSPATIVKLIFVKKWHNSCNEFMSCAQKFPDASLPDVTWSVSLTFSVRNGHLRLSSEKNVFFSNYFGYRSR